MIGVALALAVVAAVISVGVRRLQKSRSTQRRPGATIHRPLSISGFDEIDAAVQSRRCWCGGAFVISGETSRAIGDRRFRVVRMICSECERDELVYFDVTEIFH